MNYDANRMNITERIQLLMAKRRHPSWKALTPARRLEIGAEIQILQMRRDTEDMRQHLIDADLDD